MPVLMSATRELHRRLRAEKSQPPFEPCLPRPTKEPPSGAEAIVLDFVDPAGAGHMTLLIDSRSPLKRSRRCPSDPALSMVRPSFATIMDLRCSISSAITQATCTRSFVRTICLK